MSAPTKCPRCGHEDWLRGSRGEFLRDERVFSSGPRFRRIWQVYGYCKGCGAKLDEWEETEEKRDY